LIGIIQLPTPLPAIFAGMLLRILSLLLVDFCWPDESERMWRPKLALSNSAINSTPQIAGNFAERFLLSPIALALALSPRS